MEQLAIGAIIREFTQKYLLLTLTAFFFGGIASWALHSWVNEASLRDIENVRIENVQLRNRVVELTILQGQLAKMAQTKAVEANVRQKKADVLSLELETLKIKTQADINPYDLPKMIVLKPGGTASVFKGRLLIEMVTFDPGKCVYLSLRDLEQPEDYLFVSQAVSAGQSKIFQVDDRAYELKVAQINQNNVVIIISPPVYY